jgi:hypothetical protein
MYSALIIMFETAEEREEFYKATTGIRIRYPDSDKSAILADRLHQVCEDFAREYDSDDDGSFDVVI